MLVSQSNLVYYQDKNLQLHTLEHPLTQRYLKMLEIHRLDMYAVAEKSRRRDSAIGHPDLLFHGQFSKLQIPCQDCGQSQSTKHCDQCVQSFCDSCFELLHAGSRGRRGHSVVPTAAGSDCSVCQTKSPNLFCAPCADYFCFSCFDGLHRKGKRSEHAVMRVAASNGNAVSAAATTVCEECSQALATLHCDFCSNFFCLACFWACHMNGNRRRHRATQTSVRPLCGQCNCTRASVFCDQCRELLCTDCFTSVHSQGNRRLHVFRDAMNFAQLLETVNSFARIEFMENRRLEVLAAITRIQAWARGRQQRAVFVRRRDLAVVIQKRWRGGETRKKLLGMMDQWQWRKQAVMESINPVSTRVREERVIALASKLKIASLQQAKVMEGIVDGERVEVESLKNPPPHIAHDSTRASVKTRLTSNVRRTSTLRKLFSFLNR